MDEMQVTGGTPEKGLLRTLTGHSSASADQTLKVWGLESGRELRTLQGHAASVNSVAVTPGRPTRRLGLRDEGVGERLNDRDIRLRRIRTVLHSCE